MALTAIIESQNLVLIQKNKNEATLVFFNKINISKCFVLRGAIQSCVNNISLYCQEGPCFNSNKYNMDIEKYKHGHFKGSNVGAPCAHMGCFPEPVHKCARTFAIFRFLDPPGILLLVAPGSLY